MTAATTAATTAAMTPAMTSASSLEPGSAIPSATTSPGSRRRVLAALGLLPAASLVAHGQPAPAWPTRTVRIVVPSAAGSPWDPQARLLAERLATVYGQPFIVENRSGATGMIGMDVVAKATDGHTLGMMFMPHTLIPSLFDKVPYDTVRDLQPVTQVEWTYNVLVVHPDVPVRSLRELVEHVRARPGKLTFVSGGNGSPAHVVGEYFKQQTGTFAVHVPYRGPVAALQDLVGGRAEFMFATAGSAIPLIRAGRIRALAVTSPQRVDALPDVPTAAEAGYPAFTLGSWAGLVASNSVPAAALPRLATEVGKVLAEPAQVERFRANGVLLAPGTPEDFGRLIREELAKWAPIVKKAKITVD